MNLFIGLYMAGFVACIISFYKLIDLRGKEEEAFIVWILALLWPLSIPLIIVVLICMKIHKLLLKL